MLVFLQIPRSTTSPYKAFREALGDEAVGWIGRNIRDSDLDSPDALASFKVIGGRMTLARALVIPNVTTYATIVNDPVSRALGQWNEAIGDQNHPHHAATHTFMQRELFEEDHPFGRAMSNVATKYLLKNEDGPCTADAALAAVKSLRFIVGEATRTKAFAVMVARRLGLEPGTLDEANFRAPQTNPKTARGELLRLINTANAEDLALIDGLRGMMEPKRPVVRTRGENAGRPADAERPARPDRPRNPERRARADAAGGDPSADGERPANAARRPNAERRANAGRRAGPGRPGEGERPTDAERPQRRRTNGADPEAQG